MATITKKKTPEETIEMDTFDLPQEEVQMEKIDKEINPGGTDEEMAHGRT
jgi:hypothetical protein